MSTILRVALVASATWVLRPPSAVLSDRAAVDSASERPASSGFAESGGLLVLKEPAAAMIRVPASVFEMGSTPEEVVESLVDCQKEPLGPQCFDTLFSNEQPNRTVTLSSYWLDQTEVTVAAYSRCVEVRRCRPIPYDAGGTRFDRPTFPVSLVTWDEAREYCAFRGARLPTEAEFERAARGGAHRRFPWGDLANSHAANHGRLAWDSTDASDGFAELAPVGSFPAGRTREGFLDLAGNVAEWALDRYAPEYSTTDVTDPTGPPASSGAATRVVRGGSYVSAMPWLRAASRGATANALPFLDARAGGIEVSTRRPWIGFRCAKDARQNRSE